MIISNIDRSEFEPNVDWPIIRDHVQMIENVDVIIIPKGVSKFQMLTRTKNADIIKTA